MNDSDSVSLIAAFLFGFFGNFHCFGMCGGIITALSLNALKNKKKVFICQFIYNSGRIISYCFAGIFVNVFGFFIFNLLGIDVKIVFNIFFPTIIIFFGIRLLNIFNNLFFKLEKFSYDFFNFLYKKFYLLAFFKSPYKEFVIGLLWGSVPCGLVYSALAMTFISNSLTTSFLIMLCFGVGTLPSIFFVGVFYSRLIFFKKKSLITKMVGFFTIAYGFFFLVKLVIKKDCHLQQIIFYFS